MKPLLLVGGLALVTLASPASAQTVTKILDNGPDAEKKVLVVIGDGYSAADMADYQQYVQDTVIDGVFTHDDFFRANHTAFNVYRVDVNSAQSGVSLRRYSSGCGTSPDNDDVLNTTCNATSSPACYTHDTAFDYVYTGCWGRCWMEGSANTASAIKTLLDQLVPKRDLEVRVLNVLTGEGGGCGGGGTLAVTSGTSWQVLGHEMGHMVANLFDEYTASAYSSTTYPGSVDTKNCSTDLASPVWADLITIPTPSTFDSATMDVDDTVGMFQGCGTYGVGVYRPTSNDRMRGNSNQFCPVCSRVLSQTLAGFTDSLADYAFYANYPGATCQPVGGAALTYTTGANISNNTAATASVLCPTRRIQDANGAFTNHLMGQAFVVDQSPTEDVCCQLFARTPAGDLATGANVCSTGSSSGYQQLLLDFPKVRMPYTFAHFALKCTLPAVSSGKASSVLTYRIGEQTY
ncbi:M64 family metallopeptidase [Vitiosangium sp. GDMCC 1.1324]|uniref:M64 family metallopeptidase n=1 Tax=Vitiosangium sp. (strain GDMCC 1.1324) TaxID=2138576 RepID=UPI0011B5860B|nr:M64 family metallopeptidase [Vitiosangium sp. GDMCC 1.1324]